jgi:CheY-like chemotaxis protein
MSRVSENGWVLVVDDDEDTREFLHDLLVSEGYRVIASRGGEEALRQLAAPNPPAVVLLDIHMPAMDGWALLEAHRRKGLGQRTHVIVMTADDGAVEDCDYDVVIKPIDFAKLVRLIAKHLAPAGERVRMPAWTSAARR